MTAQGIISVSADRQLAAQQDKCEVNHRESIREMLGVFYPANGQSRPVRSYTGFTTRNPIPHSHPSPSPSPSHNYFHLLLILALTILFISFLFDFKSEYKKQYKELETRSRECTKKYDQHDCRDPIPILVQECARWRECYHQEIQVRFTLVFATVVGKFVRILFFQLGGLCLGVLVLGAGVYFWSKRAAHAKRD